MARTYHKKRPLSLKGSLFNALHFFLSLFLFSTWNRPALADENSLFDDLAIVDYWNRRINDTFPVQYNALLEGGLFTMPTARVGEDGEMALGYAWLPPYRIYSARAMIHPHIEVTLNYRIFKGVEDPVLSPFGFGDLSDKGANVKFAILRPEDSGYELPGVAIGFQDFLGTRAFKSRYFVLTKVFMDEAMEISLGIGEWRIRGLFGGISWMPFRSCLLPCQLNNMTFSAEWDATPYESKKIEPHPDGRVKNNPVNFGVKWRLYDMIDLSASYIRGDAFAFQASLFYNLGCTKGFVPKIEDPIPYQAPAIREPLGPLRPRGIFAAEIASSFLNHGFDVLRIREERGPCNEKILRINAINLSWRLEPDARLRLAHLLGQLTPSDFDKAVIVIEDDMMSVHEYHFYLPYARRYVAKEMGFVELSIATPMTEVTSPCYGELLYRKKRDLIDAFILPDFHSFFGSARGKFKYSLGAALAIDGFLEGDVHYSCVLTHRLFADLEDIQDVDRLNPSQIINVRSDIISYFKKGGLQVEELYINKVWNVGRGYFFEGALGYFDRMYGGVFGEILYYPVGSSFAVGLEGAVVKRRTTSGMGFSDKIRKLDGFTPTYVPFLGSQGFVNLYYDLADTQLQLGLKAGRFLAKDWGVRYEVSRYFDSGLRLTLWYTRTNGHDKINGETYYDKGVMISMPLDIFYTHSSRKRFSYGMSAWLRDVGQFVTLKESLYERINDLRQN